MSSSPGVVTQLGSEVTNLRVGDRVWFVVPYSVQVLVTRL